MDQSTTLSDLLALNLHECEEEVKNIVDKGNKNIVRINFFSALKKRESLSELFVYLKEIRHKNKSF